MPQILPKNEKLEPLGGGYFAVVSKEHTFGADALLLADFAAVRGARTLCDLCAGCGIVSLIWCAGGADGAIDAVEIQNSAVELIKAAAKYNKFTNIRAVEADLRTLDKSFYGRYDLVACNPPYKKSGSGAQSSGAAARAARHETLCTLEDVITVSSRLLKNGGRFCMCQRPERLTDILVLMRQNKVEPKRLRFVQQKTLSKPWLVLVEGKKGGKPGLIAESALIVENDSGGYSPEMSRIYNKFCDRASGKNERFK